MEACERNKKQRSDDRNVTYCALEAKRGDKTRFLKQDFSPSFQSYFFRYHNHNASTTKCLPNPMANQ